MSCAIINIHNTLACASALVKEKGVRGLLPFKTTNQEEFKTRKGYLSRFFQLSSIIAWVQCIPACNELISLARGLLSYGAAAAIPTAVTTLNNARLLSLQSASITRLTLVAGVLHTFSLATATQNNAANPFRDHPFFATLSGIVSSVCLGVGGTMLFVARASFSSSAGVVNKALLLEGMMLVLGGLVMGYYSVSGFAASWKKNEKNLKEAESIH